MQNTLVSYSKNIPKILVIKLGFLLLARLASLQTTARLHGLYAIAFHNNKMPSLITNIFGIFLEKLSGVFWPERNFADHILIFQSLVPNFDIAMSH